MDALVASGIYVAVREKCNHGNDNDNLHHFWVLCCQLLLTSSLVQAFASPTRYDNFFCLHSLCLVFLLLFFVRGHVPTLDAFKLLVVPCLVLTWS
ncbi:hypothetical protein P153DRAFT_39261 [Dothidotthia symphoricarpi CBS 119687]|uniref:Uncharacterized protein n=1 Tax=Dothidotthia symphoricarpi CBS 119687 TaxID=1392245 RepID=A0A6A6A979_9PLEO|nr:uncharacterized protein P153DRAFT_39261 [Dothidotthia symphoricarpi CBS 119687]KAF2128522.1 hypothetical protein P153DRAFT_39261 [Dothidotthia symphoricarpi CBS 119687]